MMASSVDDLPAPFGPISPTISPGMDLEREAVNRLDRAVVDVETGDNERAHGRPRAHSALAEVRGGDVEIGADLVGGPFRERRALVEHADAVADRHDQRHVVVDEEHSRIVVVANRADDVCELGNLGLGQSRRGLVEQDEARVRRERPRDPEPPFVAVRERRTPRVGVGGRPSTPSSSTALLCLRGPMPTPSAATSTFSCTESGAEERLCWNVPRARAGRGGSGSSGSRLGPRARPCPR